jgi:hypothetical protein
MTYQITEIQEVKLDSDRPWYGLGLVSTEVLEQLIKHYRSYENRELASKYICCFVAELHSREYPKCRSGCICDSEYL